MAFDALIVTRWGARFHGRHFACSLGRGGISREKREGDGATPAGQHRIVDMLYRPDRVMGARLPGWARPIGLGDLWSDDPGDPDYNHLVRPPHGFTHEALRRADPLYDLILVTDWNYPDAKPGIGSAIFLHRWRRPVCPTAGCVGFSAQDIVWIARRVVYGTRVIIRG